MLLSEAIDNLLEAARIVSREKALAPIMKTLEPQFAKIFRKQGKLFLPQFAKLKSQFTEALDEARLKRILDRIHAETSDEFKATIKASSANAYGAGIEAGSDLGAAISFSLKHPAAVEWLKSHAAEAVTGINETTRTVIGDIVKNGVAEGQSYNKVAKAIRDQYEEFAVGKPQAHIQSRAHLVAVTECFPGDVLVSALPLAVSMLRFPAAFSNLLGMLVLAHGDFAGGGIIGQGSETTILGATRRWYEGGLVKITTASGHELTGTPNHPVLANGGWVGLGRLVEGDDVICCGGRQKVGFSNPHVDHMPAEISEVFHALQSRPGIVSDRIQGRNVDFHGDGRDSEIEIIRADSFLRDRFEPTFSEPRAHNLFAEADVGESALTENCLRMEIGIRLFSVLNHSGEFAHATSRSSVGVCEEGEPFIRGHSGPRGLPRFRRGADVNVGLSENCSDSVIRDFVTPGNALAGLPGHVTRDRIVSIDRLEFAGHVYNLQTSIGCYIANGIVTHNCHTAYGEGHRAGIEPLLKVGLEVEHFWQSMDDELVSDGCLENENAGWIPYDEPFPSGDLAEPRFPGCRCGVLFQLKPTEGTASD